MNYDVIIIGAGPAGVSAGLYAKRANLNVLILYSGKSELEKAHKIDNYYGFPDGITGKDLFQNGIEQAKNLEIDVKNEEVIDVEVTNENTFKIKSENSEYESKVLIMATGNKKIKPNIPGIEKFEGKGISYCAICDGFFYRNKNVAVLGNGKFAISEADDLKNIVSNLTILTNGLEMEEKTTYKMDTRKIKQIHGENKVKSIEFEDGNILEVDGIFIAQGIAGGSNFAKKIGAMEKNDNLIVNEKMQTNIEGLYACGNLTGGLLQVNKAAYEGAKAALDAVNYIKSKKEF